MTTLTATHNSTDHNTQDGNVNIWFDVTGTVNGDEDGLYALCIDGEEVRLLDCDGCPCNTDDHHMAVVFGVCEDSLTDEMQ